MRCTEYLDSTTGKTYTFLTNKHYRKVQPVADFYKQRWQIEVFLKYIKQQLCIKSFVGTSQNAITIQVYTTHITMHILKYLQQMALYNWNLSNLVNFIILNLFVKTNLWQCIHHPYYDAKDTPQELLLKLDLSPITGFDLYILLFLMIICIILIIILFSLIYFGQLWYRIKQYIFSRQ